MPDPITTERIAPWVAGLFYGGWAAYTNVDHGRDSAIVAFIIQGGFAFVSTLLLTRLVIWLIQQQQPNPRYFVVFAQCAVVLIFIPGGLHLMAGTPDIVEAMLPGFIIGNGYAGLLIYRNRFE